MSELTPTSGTTPSASAQPSAKTQSTSPDLSSELPFIGDLLVDIADSDFIEVEVYNDMGAKYCTCTRTDAAVFALAHWGIVPDSMVSETDPNCPVHGEHEWVQPPQELADAFALAAQNIAGALVGHPYTSAQYGNPNTSRVDTTCKWVEPPVFPDDCVFCVAQTDETVERRIRGYQGQIDKEVLRGKSAHYITWLKSGEAPDGLKTESDANRRRFCELYQDEPREGKPNGWEEKPFPLISLPLRLKRKLCIMWNHIYTAWMEEEALYYDFEHRQFARIETPKAVREPDSLD